MKTVRGIAALVVSVTLTIIFPIISLVLSTCYWASVVLPLMRRMQNKPNPCVRFMYLYTSALWNLCYKPILGTRLIVVDMPQELQETSDAQRDVLDILLGNHASTVAMFPYILHEMQQYPWLNIAVKMSLMFYPYGLPGLLSGCFTFIIRGGRKPGRTYSQNTLRRRVRHAITTKTRIMLFGDGSRFTVKRRDALRNGNNANLQARANALDNVLPERYVGLQTIVAAAQTLNADVQVHVRGVFTRHHGKESLFALGKMVNEPIFVFRTCIPMTAENAPKKMTALWDEFDRIAADPERYAREHGVEL